MLWKIFQETEEQFAIKKAKASAADEVEVLSARAASNDVEVVSATPAQRFYGMSALNGKPVNITPQTYKQIDDYIEMRAQDEFRSLRRNRQYADVDDRTLMSYARDRAEQYRPQTILRTSIYYDANLPIIAEEKYGLIDKHAYRIDGYDLKNKIVYIVNPHDTKYRIELPLELYKECFSDIKIFNIDW